jgi:mannose-6-phosphate isomerase
MTVSRLIEKRVEKVWGRRDLPSMFGGAYEGQEPLGEIWFQHPEGADVELLVKYLFTSEKLSIQVHPDDDAARRAGHDRGKEEAWVILEAEAGASIGLGLKHRVGAEELRRAALDGSIEDLVDWRAAARGDVLYSPAGTIHALGPGLMLVEIQQNVDLTYRLYDYGRPRELRLEEGVRCARPEPYSPPPAPPGRADGRDILAAGRAFVLERWSRAMSATMHASPARPVWLVPLRGPGMAADQALEPGGVWLIDGETPLALDQRGEILVAYAGSEVDERLID